MSYRNLENVRASFIVSGNDRPHPNLLPQGEGTAMGCTSFAGACHANPVAGAFRFRGSMRGLVGKNPTPFLSPFCYRKTRRGRHAPSVFLNHATGHSWPQIRTVSSYAHLEMPFETGSLVDESLFKDLSKRLDGLGRKINLFTQAVEANHRTGTAKVFEHPASGIQQRGSSSQHPAPMIQP
jgi:hypothetical protein